MDEVQSRSTVRVNEIQTASVRSGKSWSKLAHFFLIGILCLHAGIFVSVRKLIVRGYPDFTVFYTAACVLRRGLGHQLYVGHIQYDVQTEFTGHLPSRRGPLPYIHPPFEALFFVPLTVFPYRQAFLIWDSFNLVMLWAVVRLIQNGVSARRPISKWEFFLGTLAFFPVFECLLQGQDSILQLLLCVLAWNALRKNSDIMAGCWFALGLFKFQLMLPIVLLIAIWKRGRVLLGFAAISAILIVVSFELVGWKAFLHYPRDVLWIAKVPRLGGLPADFLPNLHGLLMGWPLRLSGRFGAAFVGLGSLILFLFAAKKGRSANGSKKRDWQFALAISVSELIGWQTNIHDFSLLVLPLIFTADYCLDMPPLLGTRRFALLFPMLPLLFTPLWLVLWFVAGSVNLMAIPLLSWTWQIGKEIGRQDLNPTAQIKPPLSDGRVPGFSPT